MLYNEIEIFLVSLAAKGVKIAIEGERLHVRGALNSLTDIEKKQIKDEKSLLIEYINQRNALALPELKPVNKEGLHELSYAQHRMWLQQQLEPNSAYYHIPSLLRLQGQLQYSAMQKALQTLLERHHILHTNYRETGQGGIHQILSEVPTFSLPLDDLSEQNSTQRSETMSLIMQRVLETPFDLERDIMLRAHLLKVSFDEYLLIVCMHHIASDGWSIGIMAQELGELYKAYSQNLPSPLAPLFLQYADFACWQRKCLEGLRLEQHLQYWQKRLAGIPIVHNLPLDRPRTVVPSYRGGEYRQYLSAQICHGLHALSVEHGATLFMVLHAAFVTLLHRYSGDRDIVLGTPIANRGHANLAPLVGFFVNSLALRSELDSQMSFHELLMQSKERLLEAYAHQQLPFEKLVEELKPERSMAHSPLFQIQIALNNNSQDELKLPGLTISTVDKPTVYAKYELSLDIWEEDGGLGITWEYAKDLFDANTITQMARHFKHLVRELVASPQTPIGQLKMMSNEEQAALLHAWNPGGVALVESAADEGMCAHRLFESQVSARPSQIALFCAEEKISYHELNQQANQLARYLQASGVNAGSNIGLCVQRSPMMLVGLLAIFKIGACYVPLDPHYPQARLKFVMEDAGLACILVDSESAGAVVHFSGQLVDISQRQVYDNLNAGNLSDSPAGSDAAYIIYTSGSSGRPKGVVVEHASLSALLKACRQQFAIKDSDCMAALASHAFDIALFELFLPLISGAQITLIPSNITLDIPALVAAMSNCSLIHAVPSLMAEIVTYKEARDKTGSACLKTVRQLFVGGDRVSPSLVERLQQAFDNVQIVELYGPTEGTILTTYYMVPSDVRPMSSIIGNALTHAQIYVLDSSLQPVAPGIVGELCIAGAGLARGYHNREDLNVERFVEKPFSDSPCNRLYRSGDMVKWRQDGKLEYIGRADKQVKVRGYRIELGEIEHHINQFAAVNDALVQIAQTPAGEPCILAYIVNEQAQIIDIQAIEKNLAAKLPAYMVPQAILVLEAWPLNENGKIDYKALPGISEQKKGRQYEGPCNAIERGLLSIWCDLLGLGQESISRHDNFFALGGHSLLITRLKSEIQNRFAAILDTKTLFSQASIAQLAKCISDRNHIALAHRDDEINAHGLILVIAMNVPYTRAHGGANKSNRLLAEALVRAGHRVQVICPALAVPSDITLEEFKLQLRASGIELLSDGASSGSLNFSMNGVQVCAVEAPGKLIQVFSHQLPIVAADFILVSSEDPSQALLDAALKFDNQSVIYLAHTPQMLPFGPQSFYPGERRTQLLSRVREIVTISQFVADYIEQHSGFSAFVHHPPQYDIDAEFINRIDNDEVLMVNPCNIKGMPILLALADLNPSVNFRVVASWGTTPENREELTRRKNILFKASDKNLDHVFKNVKLLIVPSLWEEGFGMIVIDAMIRGIPVIASDRGGLREAKLGTKFTLPVNPIVGFNERLDANSIPYADVPEQDIRPWQQALISLLDDDDLYEECAKESQQKAHRFVSALSVVPFIERLQRLCGEKRGENSFVHKAILRLPSQSDYAVSLGQEKILILDELTKDFYGYVIAESFTLDEDVDTDSLNKAFTAMLGRHEVLRTNFFKYNGEFRQRIREAENFSISRQDMRWKSGDKKTYSNQVLARIQEFRSKRFDLENELLFRAELVLSNYEKPILTVAMHHLLSDGHSVRIFIRELNQYYLHYKEKRPLQLPELKLSYRDFSAWQRENLNALHNEKYYWLKKLGDPISKLDLPTDFHRIAKKSYKGLSERIVLEKHHAEGIYHLAEKHDASPFMVLVAIVKALLYRYSQQSDICVGTPSSGRIHPDLENQLGFFINMLCLRDYVEGGDSFDDLIKKVRQTNIEAYQHEAYPFSQLLVDLKSSRGSLDSPIFDVMVGMNHSDSDEQLTSINAQEWRVKDANVGSSQDFAFLFFENNQEIGFHLTYNSDLYLPDTISRLEGHFKMLLGVAVSKPQTKINSVEIVTSREQENLRAMNASGDVAYDSTLNLLDVFRQVFEKKGQSVALICEATEKTCCYSELDLRSNQLANALHARGVGAGDIVPLLGEPCIDLIVGLLGILKAGAAYAPINILYPSKRIQHIIDDTHAKCVVCTSDISDDTQITSEIIVISNLERQNLSVHAPLVNVKADDLAYVIYTSGTTGMPKGVMISHRNITRLFFNDEPIFSFNDQDCWTLFHNFCFDFSVWEIFGALLHGGKLVVMSSDSAKNNYRFIEVIEKYKVTVLNQVPSAFYHLLNAIGIFDAKTSDRFSSLRYVIFGGEALHPAKLKNWHKALPNTKLINMYGITETTVHVTHKRISDEEITRSVSNIGAAIPTTRTRILDGNLKLVPINVAGELFVGGAGLAKGYLGKANLTAEKFIEDPYRPGEYLYRTGDRVKLNTQFDIEYLGRIDDQVKLRGYRIELSEIDHAISALDFVHANVTLLQNDDKESARLVSYIQLSIQFNAQQSATIKANIISLLRQNLPEFMLPSAIVLVNTIPLTINGKADKARLLDFEIKHQAESDEFSITECKLGAIWTQLLDLNGDELSTEANFFELGGHSLILVKLMSKIRDEFNVELSIRETMDRPTLREMALFVDEQLVTRDVVNDNGDISAGEEQIEISV